MKRSRFSEQQIAFILRQTEEGVTVEEVCRQVGISQATYYNWEMKRLKQLDEENHRLKKLAADLSMDKGDAAGRYPAKNMTTDRKREMVDHVRIALQTRQSAAGLTAQPPGNGLARQKPAEHLARSVHIRGRV